MKTGGLKAAILTEREPELSTFRHALEACGFRVSVFRDPWQFLSPTQSGACSVVVLDGIQATVLERLLEVDASIPCAVITELAPDAFHQATEGLGVICALPYKPDAADADRLLDRLVAVGGLDPRLSEAQVRLEAMSRQHHPNCVVCWDRHPFGLKVDYRVVGEHRVAGAFACGKSYEGYSNVIHGGIVSTLLDGAMASCMLAKGIEAYTVDLRVRYRGPVEIGIPATLHAEWLQGSGPLHLLQATLEQGGKVRASARAKFFEGSPNRPSQPLPGGGGVRHLLTQARKRLV